MQNEDMQAGSLRSDTDMVGAPRGWYNRGYLPHFDGGEIVQFATYRLAESLPRAILDRIKFRRDTGQISDLDYPSGDRSYTRQGIWPDTFAEPSNS